MAQPPRVMVSELTGQVYVVTRYSIRDVGGNGVLVAHRKHEVQDVEFAAAVRMWRRFRRRRGQQL